jgi:hypothetical protein
MYWLTMAGSNASTTRPHTLPARGNDPRHLADRGLFGDDCGRDAEDDTRNGPDQDGDDEFEPIFDLLPPMVPGRKLPGARAHHSSDLHRIADQKQERNDQPGEQQTGGAREQFANPSVGLDDKREGLT